MFRNSNSGTGACQVPAAVGGGQVSPAMEPQSDRRMNSSHGNNIFIFEGERIPVFPPSSPNVAKVLGDFPNWKTERDREIEREKNEHGASTSATKRGTNH